MANPSGSIKKAWAMYYIEKERADLAESEVRILTKLMNELINDKEPKETKEEKEFREFQELKKKEEEEFRKYQESKRPKETVPESSEQDKKKIKKLEAALAAFTTPDKNDTSVVSKLKKALNGMVGL